jgi:hypothetical protein
MKTLEVHGRYTEKGDRKRFWCRMILCAELGEQLRTGPAARAGYDIPSVPVR